MIGEVAYHLKSLGCGLIEALVFSIEKSLGCKAAQSFNGRSCIDLVAGLELTDEGAGASFNNNGSLGGAPSVLASGKTKDSLLTVGQGVRDLVYQVWLSDALSE